jgi:hypothetical protein
MKKFKLATGHTIGAIAITAFVSVPNVFAVEDGGIEIADRWSVIGTINTGEDSGVVVMKDIVSRKTFTLKIGARLPHDPQFMIKSGNGNKVIVSDSNEEITLLHISESSSYDEKPIYIPASESRIVEYLNDEYQEVEQGNMTIFQHQNKMKRGIEPDEVPMPISQFGNMTDDEIKDRIEKYRDKKEEFSDAGDENGYEISYTNFSDGTEVEVLETPDVTWEDSVNEKSSNDSGDLAELTSEEDFSDDVGENTEEDESGDYE